MKKIKKILITGTSGFIGFHVATVFLKKKYKVIGIDNHNNYYDVRIKINRCKILKKFKNFIFFKFDLSNKKKTFNLIKKYKPDLIIHLAAQAGVRYSLKNPYKYVSSNILGFLNVLEAMKTAKLKKLIYASSSSVYGNSKKFPLKENFKLSAENFYGLTKEFNEKNAQIYSKFFGIKSIGLRFFTVYGSYGRPDMFISKIINKIKYNKLIDIYNKGKHHRDFTYVDDIKNIIYKLTTNFRKYNKVGIYNICSGKVVNIMSVVKNIEKITNKKANLKYISLQKGDMLKTHGDNKLLRKKLKLKEFTNINKGLTMTLNSKNF